MELFMKILRLLLLSYYVKYFSETERNLSVNPSTSRIWLAIHPSIFFSSTHFTSFGKSLKKMDSLIHDDNLCLKTSQNEKTDPTFISKFKSTWTFKRKKKSQRLNFQNHVSCSGSSQVLFQKDHKLKCFFRTLLVKQLKITLTCFPEHISGIRCLILRILQNSYKIKIMK